MEQTVSTAWYVKKCALGTFVCCAVEFALLALMAALMLGGAIGEACFCGDRGLCRVQRGE